MVIVKNNTTSLHGIGPNCRLMPGANEVPDEAWEAVVDHPMVQWRLNEGDYEVLGTGEKGVRGLPPKKAVALVKETYDHKLLDKWAEDETRQSVKKALNAQIKFMALPPGEEVE